MKKSLVILSVLLFATITVSGLSVNMTPLPDNLYGGNSYELYLNFTSSESCTVSILPGEILPDPTGINIEYSETNFTFTDSKSIIVYVNISVYVLPDDDITLIIPYEYTEDADEEDKPTIKKKTITYASNTYVPQPPVEEPWYHPPLPDPIPRINIQDPITLTIYRVFDYTPYAIAGIAGLVILGFFIYYILKKKKHKNKLEQEEK